MNEKKPMGGGSRLSKTPINKGSKSRKIITGMLVVVLMVLLIGVSYAAWRYTFTGNANTINTPSIELELLESTDEIINITNALPMSDTQGKSQTKTFNFAVTTKTSAIQDIGYSLKIEKITVDSGYTALSDNQIKVYLTDYNGTELLTPTLISDLSNYVLYGNTNSHNATTTKIQDKYKLRAWIDWEVDASNWNQNTKLQYKFKIGVTEKQDQAGGDTLYWDGYETGRTVINIPGSNMQYVHIYDVPESLQDITGAATIVLTAKNRTTGESQTFETKTVNTDVFDFGIAWGEYFLMTKQDNYEEAGLLIPKKGIYALVQNIPEAEDDAIVYASTLTINGYTGFPRYN